jgi:hypothetical protein
MLTEVFRARLIDQTAILPETESAANIIPVFDLRHERAQEALRESACRVERLGL